MFVSVLHGPFGKAGMNRSKSPMFFRSDISHLFLHCRDGLTCRIGKQFVFCVRRSSCFINYSMTLIIPNNNDGCRQSYTKTIKSEPLAPENQVGSIAYCSRYPLAPHLRIRLGDFRGLKAIS